MAGKPWLKLWIEWIHDPKMLDLDLGEKGAWCLLLSLAQECAADGYLVKGNGTPMSLKEIARCLHISERSELYTFHSMIKKMEICESLTWNSDALLIANFEQRQALAPSETKESVRDRVRQYRERKKKAEEERESTKEKDIVTDIEGERECNGVTPVTQTPSSGINVTESALQMEINSPKSEQLISKKLRKSSFGEGENVLLTKEELAKLQERYGPAGAEDRINALSLYKGSTGKKYASDYLTLLNWERRDNKGKEKYSPSARRQPGTVPTDDELDQQAKAKGVIL